MASATTRRSNGLRGGVNVQAPSGAPAQRTPSQLLGQRSIGTKPTITKPPIDSTIGGRVPTIPKIPGGLGANAGVPTNVADTLAKAQGQIAGFGVADPPPLADAGGFAAEVDPGATEGLLGSPGRATEEMFAEDTPLTDEAATEELLADVDAEAEAQANGTPYNMWLSEEELAAANAWLDTPEAQTAPTLGTIGADTSDTPLSWINSSSVIGDTQLQDVAQWLANLVLAPGASSVEGIESQFSGIQDVNGDSLWIPPSVVAEIMSLIESGSFAGAVDPNQAVAVIGRLLNNYANENSAFAIMIDMLNNNVDPNGLDGIMSQLFDNAGSATLGGETNSITAATEASDSAAARALGIPKSFLEIMNSGTGTAGFGAAGLASGQFGVTRGTDFFNGSDGLVDANTSFGEVDPSVTGSDIGPSDPNRGVANPAFTDFTRDMFGRGGELTSRGTGPDGRAPDGSVIETDLGDRINPNTLLPDKGTGGGLRDFQRNFERRVAPPKDLFPDTPGDATGGLGGPSISDQLSDQSNQNYQDSLQALKDTATQQARDAQLFAFGQLGRFGKTGTGLAGTQAANIAAQVQSQFNEGLRALQQEERTFQIQNAELKLAEDKLDETIRQFDRGFTLDKERMELAWSELRQRPELQEMANEFDLALAQATFTANSAAAVELEKLRAKITLALMQATDASDFDQIMALIAGLAPGLIGGVFNVGIGIADAVSGSGGGSSFDGSNSVVDAASDAADSTGFLNEPQSGV